MKKLIILAVVVAALAVVAWKLLEKNKCRIKF